ncbi:AAA domain-containing protein [Haloactinopolyspora alba]|uniref:AAA domain-containing protein n=1 Tax=Haloactinopolyspora alba TaxID=648780 RepID=A0A2P8DLY0_9ACTN|nr:AAA domain-containing protein [Haloactinopolyspora alba]PSK98222.1 AAA domain-containing protein [Haloactinopolyspora alba]
MNDPAPTNVRTDHTGDARSVTPHRTLRDTHQTEGRFVAVRPASTLPVPTASLVAPAPEPRPAPECATRPEPAGRDELPAGDRAALLIGTAVHDHEDFPELASAGAGIRHMKQVLERPDVGMMDTCLVVGDATRGQMMRGIETFLEEREYPDTVLVYLSGYAAVSERDGRLYLVAKDTDPADLERTAVPADFLRRQLQECRAPSKVVLLDYCTAGTVTTGVVLPEPPGVYVIAAAEGLPAVPETGAGTIGTSAFTAEVVEGLSSGRVKDGLGPWVTADDLAEYLTRRAAAATSTLSVPGNHVIARSAVRPLSLLGGDTTERSLAAVPKATRWSRSGVTDLPGWRDLVHYYRACLADAPSPVALPSRGDAPDRYVPIGSGAETLLSGADSTAPAPDGVDTFDWKERELWYGYPLVTLAGGGRRHSESPLATAHVAPLLVQRVEVTVDSRGAAALRPTGPVMPHAGVLQACLDEQEAAGVLSSWRQTWEPGDTTQMLVAVRQLMKRLGLAETAPMDPAVLAGDDVGTATRTGVHNAAAVLYVESTRASATTASSELTALADMSHRVAGTALEPLGAPAGRTAAEAPADSSVPVAVTPEVLGDSQSAVLEDAMRQQLTVATTPPGTGKERLLVAAVATAVAAGQRVLLVSADERLRRVVDRCAALAPGTLIRTGDAQARAEEKQLLRELLRSSRAGGDHRPAAAVAGELADARAELEGWRAGLAERVELEATLRKTCSARAAAAERIGLDVAVLESAWPDDDAALRAWIERARSLGSAKVLHDRRRGRAAAAYLRAAGADVVEPSVLRAAHDDADVFDALLLFARAELRVREVRSAVARVSDEDMESSGDALTRRCAELSEELVAAVVAERTVRARSALDARRAALEPGGRDRRKSQRELAGALGGWAVTVDGADQLAMEPGLFDLVIVDEAHDVPVAAMLPLLFRGRRALVLGDPARRGEPAPIGDHRQRAAREHAGLSASWLEERRLTHRTDSAYDAAAARVREVALLDQHDGCHPRIARIVDEVFYDGRLTVVTDVRTLRRAHDPETGQSTLLLWEDVHGTPERGPNGGSWRNQAEIDRVVWAVNELRDQLPDGATVGVLTPFRAQAAELRSMFRFEPVPVGSLDDPEIGMCDAVVVSLVVGAEAPTQTVRWVESHAQLWNAALTRARSHVVTVGHHAFWTSRAGIARDLARRSSVRSFHVRPLPPEAADDPVAADGVAELLSRRLADAGYTRIESNAVLDGYRCDLLVGTEDGTTAVLLDRGVAPNEDPARHLRRMFGRRRLLDGVRPETEPALGPVTRVLRVPAWQVRSGGAVPGLID